MAARPRDIRVRVYKDIITKVTGVKPATEELRRMKVQTAELDRETRKMGSTMVDMGDKYDRARLKTARLTGEIEDFGISTVEAKDHLRAFNASLLGVTMSMLGLMFNISWLISGNKELSRTWREVMSPMMAVFSIALMVTSGYQMLTSAALALSVSMKVLTASMFGVAFLAVALTTQSKELRAIFAGLAAATFTLAVAFKLLAITKVAAAGPLAPVVAALAAVGIGIIVGALAAYLEKGGIVMRPTLAVVGERGPEAVIPLERARPIGPQITIEHLEIRTEDPDAFGKRMAEVLRREAFIR